MKSKDLKITIISHSKVAMQSILRYFKLTTS